MVFHMFNSLLFKLSIVATFCLLHGIDNKSENEKAFHSSGGDSLPSLSYDGNIYLTENYASYYYSNLKRNYSYNRMQSCGYVAISMLLSFYDTYWDDDFIPESYDEPGDSHDPTEDYLTLESTGVFREGGEYVAATIDEYELKIEEYQDEVFQYFLILYGRTLFNYAADDPYGMTHSKIGELLDSYIYDYRGFSEDDVEVNLGQNVCIA